MLETILDYTHILWLCFCCTCDCILRIWNLPKKTKHNTKHRLKHTQTQNKTKWKKKTTHTIQQKYTFLKTHVEISNPAKLCWYSDWNWVFLENLQYSRIGLPKYTNESSFVNIQYLLTICCAVTETPFEDAHSKMLSLTGGSEIDLQPQDLKNRMYRTKST